MTMHDKHKAWLEARGIDTGLAEKFGLETVIRGGKAWLAVPYREAGETVNHKYRLTSEKDHRMDDGAPLLLWNADCLQAPEVRNGQWPVVITEGEWDAMAAIQAGAPAAVSVPNGAPSNQTTDLDTAKRYEWVDLRADLVALLGADRCRFVEYPFPSKDLNEVLLDHGAERVANVLFAAKPFPVQGLYGIEDFPEKGEVRSYGVGIPAISEMIALVPGTLTVLTGFSNMGKSTLVSSIAAHAMRNHFPICLASFETDVKPILRDSLRCALLGCGPHEMRAHPDLVHADACIRERLTIISQAVDEDMEMDLGKFLELCRVAVVRHGAKMIVLDPWNELEHKRKRDESETDYIGRAIRAIKRFAKQYDVAFWLVAHPTKPQQGVNKVPGLYDISGSANFANKADYGLTYHRPNPTENRATIRINKVRMGLPGRKDEATVTFDFRTSTFEVAA
jgi:twinkle protein